LACGILLPSLVLLAASSAQPPVPHAPPAKPAQDELAADLNARLSRDVAPLLATYCLACHSGERAKGDQHLDQLKTIDDALAGEVDIRMIKEMVGSAQMPPPDKQGARPHPQPTEHERIVITQWADALLSYVPVDAPIDPGWFTIHRLNRTEYRNTLRDLLGIDPKTVDLAAKLPRDDTGYGFDNIADVLSTSPLAVEQYLAAAEQAIDAALGPIVELGDHPKNLRPLEGTNGQALPNGGFFLYSNGPAGAQFIAPLTGDYMVRIRAWETPAGNERSRMALRDGSRNLKEFTVSGTREKPQEFQHRVRLTQGAHTLTTNFLNDYYVKDKADRNLGVESISVAGPLDEAGTERPPQWKQLFSLAPANATEAARAEAILKAFATRAYRRPATTPQVAALLRLFRTQRTSGQSFEQAIRTSLAATLVSPNFLFRALSALPDAKDPDARYKLDGYELASRLSYFLWSSAPDQPLLDAAADNSLRTDAVLAAQVRRMIADPRSSAFVENFAGQWLQLRALDAVAIDRARFPDYTDQLRSDMTAEATAFLGDILHSNRSVLDFVSSRDTFLNARLASFYDVPNVKGDDLRRVTLPETSPRGGVLTMAAVLTLTSNTTRTSPVKRGLFVLDQILGAPPPPPPADIPPLEQAAHANPDATVRERLAIHTANASCAACHNRLDPIGLSFEHFDAIGKWRDTENGKPIDATGTLPDKTELNGAADLKKTLLARSDQFVEALSAKVLTYALGRGVEPFDRPAVRQIAQRTRGNGDKFQSLIESVVLSETFRTCRARKPSHD
jgi:mono/diheme cytochrome c family protein